MPIVSRSRNSVSVSLLLVTMLIGIVGGAVAGGAAGFLLASRQQENVVLSPIRGSASTPAGVATPLPRPEGDMQLTLTEENSVIDAVRATGPSVVTVISTTGERPGGFGRRFAETSLGSGVVIDPRGYIVTNEHVIHGTMDLSVVLASGEEHPARLIGTDLPFTDLAVIKIEANQLSVADFGDSDGLVPGQRVVAIGSALGDFRNSVTQGIVSGLNRSWRSGQNDGNLMEDLIQTDAAINHGNSGGALVNLIGQVIGINTSVIRTTPSGERVEGIGFAIPSNTVRLVVEQIIEQGRVSRPYLGIVHQTITSQLARFYGLPSERGAYIVSIDSESPAEAAALQEGDIITKIGDFELTDTAQYLPTLMRFRPEQQVELTIFRGNRQQIVTVTLSER